MGKGSKLTVCFNVYFSYWLYTLSRLKYVQDFVTFEGLGWCFFPPIIKQLRGAEGMAYQLRSLAALPEYLGLIPGTPNCS